MGAAAASPAFMNVMLGLSVAGTAYSGLMEYQRGKAAAQAAENESRRAAQQEESQLREEQIERRERLIRALSSQNASIGASGARLGGSALNVMETDQKQFEQEDFRAKLSGSSKVGAIRASGQNSAAAHRMGARLSLVDTATKLGSIGMQAYTPPKK